MNHVEGKDRGDVTLYALSTCPRCGRTKDFLNDIDVAYDYVDIDLLEKDEKRQVVEEIKQCNPKKSLPTLKINGKCIIGLKKEEIREAIGI